MKSVTCLSMFRLRIWVLLLFVWFGAETEYVFCQSNKEQTATAVVEAWRNADGKACFELLAFRPGVSWASAFIHRVAREANAPVVFDEIGGNVTIAQELRRKRPGVKVVPLPMKHVGGAALLLAREVHDGNVEHYNQPDLNVAVESVSWRPMGRNTPASSLLSEVGR